MRSQATLLALLLGCAIFSSPVLSRTLSQIGGNCASLAPENRAECCLQNPDDPACAGFVPSPSPTVVGGDCASRGPQNLAACCAENPDDPACAAIVPSPAPGPVIGGDCASRGPENLAACCAENPDDPACPPVPPSPPSPVVGSTCISTGPSNWWGCCESKFATNTPDSSCPPPQCGVLTSAVDVTACCAFKGGPTNDATCPQPIPVSAPITVVCYDLNQTLTELQAIKQNSTQALAQTNDPAQKEAIGLFGQQQMIDFISNATTAVDVTGN